MIGGSADDTGYDLVYDQVGDIVYVGGHTNSFGAGGYDALLLALDGTTGALLYSRTYGGTGDELAYSIERHHSGDLFLVGFTQTLDSPK